MPTTEQDVWFQDMFGTASAGQLAPTQAATSQNPAAPEPTVDAAKDAAAPPRVGTKGATIRIINATGADLKLVASELLFKKTAHFAPQPPAIVPGRDGTLHTEAFFNVIETTAGSSRSGGGATYHIERRITNSFFAFSWSGGDGIVKAEGPYTTGFHGETDSEAGDYYEFILSETPQNEEELQVRFDIFNNSGVDMALVSVTLDDPQHSEFALKPASKIENTLTRVSRVQALDKEHDKAAGTVIYRLLTRDKPHTARMSWQKDGRPIGVMDPNDGEFIIEGTGSDQEFKFTIEPNAGPVPSTGGHSSITIVNKSGFELASTFNMLDGKSATFKSQPPASIPDGATISFEVVSEDPHDPDTDGIVAYQFDPNDQIGGKPVVVNLTWRTNDKPFAKIVPETDGFTVDVEPSGDDTTFTVNGPALDFTPPEKIKQPTLRQGDNNKDGWVEYLQESLNHHLNVGLTVDGNFEAATYKALIAFQNKHKSEGVMVDGVVGNQTWALLRDGAPEKPSTDGRKPHTELQEGKQTRWIREDGVVRFDKARDALIMLLVSVGTVDDMVGRKVRVRVTAPDTTAKVEDCPIGSPIPSSTTGQGSQHEVLLSSFSKLFDPKASAAPPGDYLVESYFDQELGGDKFSETVTVPA